MFLYKTELDSRSVIGLVCTDYDILTKLSIGSTKCKTLGGIHMQALDADITPCIVSH